MVPERIEGEESLVWVQVVDIFSQKSELAVPRRKIGEEIVRRIAVRINEREAAAERNELAADEFEELRFAEARPAEDRQVRLQQFLREMKLCVLALDRAEVEPPGNLCRGS